MYFSLVLFFAVLFLLFIPYSAQATAPPTSSKKGKDSVTHQEKKFDIFFLFLSFINPSTFSHLFFDFALR
jgi:arginine exporter protein ArgO